MDPGVVGWISDHLTDRSHCAGVNGTICCALSLHHLRTVSCHLICAYCMLMTAEVSLLTVNYLAIVRQLQESNSARGLVIDDFV